MEPYSPPSGPAAVPAGLTLASIGARAGAWILDEIIVSIPAVVVIVAVMASRVDLGSSPPPDFEEITEAMPAWLGFVPIGFRIAYDAVLVAWLGRTVGMMAVRIQVQSVAGGRLPWWQAGIRAMVPGLAQTVPVFGPFARIGVYLSATFDAERRGLHDRAAGSLVIAVPRPAPLVPPAGYQGYPVPYQGWPPPVPSPPSLPPAPSPAPPPAPPGGTAEPESRSHEPEGRQEQPG